MAKRQTKRGISREEFEHRMDFMELKLDQIERKLQDKADEIVAIELLQHRREIDDLSEAIDRIDQQLRKIEEELNGVNRTKEAEEQERPRFRAAGKTAPIMS